MGILEVRAAGLYCPAGDFYIDPWQPVERAVITHAHGDHACPGSRYYLATADTAALLRVRLGTEITVQETAYGETLTLGEARVSLHPAGHILGSAQVRLEHRGEVWVAAGDFKLAADPTCLPFEPQRCHTFITESTFGLPIFRWPNTADVMSAIHAWWRGNQEAGKASLLFAYSLGKAQRILAALDTSIGPVHAHEWVASMNQVYRGRGIPLPETGEASRPGALILAPPLLMGSPWAKKLGSSSTALASGWMRIRGTRRRRSLDRGFVLSDHGDWDELLRAIDATGAENLWVTHGFQAPLARWLAEHGRQAVAVETHYETQEEPGA